MTQVQRGVLPNEPIFTRLLQNLNEVKHVVVHDSGNGVDADYPRLVSDVHHMQKELHQSLPETVFEDERKILRESNPYILVLLPGSYDFVVAALSVLSIGGAFAPLATGLLPEEMLYLVKGSKAVCILTDEKGLKLATQCQELAASQDVDVAVLRVSFGSVSTNSEPIFEVDQELTIAPHRPSVMLYTSGTSGPPKGVVHTRQLFSEMHALGSLNDVGLSHTPIHWASGMLSLMGGVLAGARTEIMSPSAEAVWERLRKGGLTNLGGSPRFWTELTTYYQDNLSKLPLNERNVYIQAVQSLHTATTRGSMPDPALLRFWREDLGKRLQVNYGITEVGSSLMNTVDETDVNLECCLGRPVSDAIIKLSEGDHGEMLVKKSTIYLNDEKATAAVFDSEGFYKTGDIVRRVGEDYVFEGRVSTDFIKYRGMKVSIVETEMQLLQLPFISEGCILPVSHPSYGHIVAALIRLRDPKALHKTQTVENLDLTALRDVLRDKLPVFMLPTALRILEEGEEVPRTASLKVVRAKAAAEYFPLSNDGELPSNVETTDLNDQEVWPQKAWDWGGLRVGKDRVNVSADLTFV
ncbi:Acyl-CoA ligase oryP [Cladobotryum mycophilum]|uniref:Acyl-CoA ligase oryP n=1 Tax=Cladobotryum mycophilum TaxID=491253 RepID=A0ABR0SV36_9HYPO